MVEELGGLDVLVLHHGTQDPVQDVREIDTTHLVGTFRVNVYSRTGRCRRRSSTCPTAARSS
jgi:hypothetical protein